jgi:hypothetical protein
VMRIVEHNNSTVCRLLMVEFPVVADRAPRSPR